MDGGSRIALPTEKIIAERRGGVGWLIFNQPERRNAISQEMWDGIAVAGTAFAADPEIRVVIMRGAGDKAFTAGADISEFEKVRADAAAEEAYHARSAAAGRAMKSLTVPLVAMIRGFCVGGGMAMAMRADLRIASSDSKFGIPAAKLGVSYAQESLERLTQLVGPSMAKHVMFLGRLYTADQALAMGLVNEVVAPEELEATVEGIAAEIAANAPLSIRAAKTMIEQSLIDAPRRDHDGNAALERACFDSEDYKEGRRAFMEKRRPVFRGR
ncbi:enoyl-CoA hydratase/carnithine racemase [Stella humosa]|uniref:Enoyl-CoA hydratase/carnithine racemase n=1 Tax=Stella humosa TaxID=94 RepID=A0A3N1LHB7_9PROT|nr:enoyl-CoA hydratase [Stella humosa]ROP90907.1 enoyl-CoA hydratase/carnithine racemase [Stella humosa]BBK34743.1 enoyl-CoA hydratase [Stella humosa]